MLRLRGLGVPPELPARARVPKRGGQGGMVAYWTSSGLLRMMPVQRSHVTPYMGDFGFGV